jgi:hypothetical protein
MLQENSMGKFKYLLLMTLFVSCNLKKTDNIIIEPFYAINTIDSSIHASFSIEPAYIYKEDNFLIHSFVRGGQTKAYVDSFVEKIRKKTFLLATWITLILFTNIPQQPTMNTLKKTRRT